MPPLSRDHLADPAVGARYWARLLRKVFAVDPLLSPTCRVEMTVVSVLTDPVVVDAILLYRAQGGGHGPPAS